MVKTGAKGLVLPNLPEASGELQLDAGSLGRSTVSDFEERPISRPKLSLRFGTRSSHPTTWKWAPPARPNDA